MLMLLYHRENHRHSVSHLQKHNHIRFKGVEVKLKDFVDDPDCMAILK